MMPVPPYPSPFTMSRFSPQGSSLNLAFVPGAGRSCADPGLHAYNSPSWYEKEGTVPTWNYVAVHAYGTLHVVEDRDGLLDILRRSVTAYESQLPEPWPFDESAGHVEKMLKAIVGFRIEITRLEGKWKQSRNQPEGRRRRVIRALSGGSDEDSQAVAAMMAEVTNKAGEDRRTGGGPSPVNSVDQDENLNVPHPLAVTRRSPRFR